MALDEVIKSCFHGTQSEGIWKAHISDSQDHRKFISLVVCLERISKAMTTLWFSCEPFIGDLPFVFSSDYAFADS